MLIINIVDPSPEHLPRIADGHDSPLVSRPLIQLHLTPPSARCRLGRCCRPIGRGDHFRPIETQRNCEQIPRRGCRCRLCCRCCGCIRSRGCCRRCSDLNLGDAALFVALCLLACRGGLLLAIKEILQTIL